MSTTLPLFWDLSAASKQKRLKASSELITALERFQLGFEAQPVPPATDDDDAAMTDGAARAASATAAGSDDDDDDEDESGEEVDDSDDEAEEEHEVDPKVARRLDRELDRQNSEDVRYSIRRLVRGLASSRESSRLGFAVALTELLSRLDTITPQQIISIVLRFSHITVSIQRQEVRDLLFARLFGLTAVVESGLLFRPSATLVDFQTAVGQLTTVGSQKSWLRESCWWAVLGAVNGLAANDVAWAADGVRWLAEFVFNGEEGKEWTAEKVALAVKMQQAYPTLAWKSLLAPTFKHASVLHPTNLPTLAKILRDTAVTSEEEDDDDEPTAGPSANPGTGSWKPNPPFVWDLILDVYFPPGADSSAPTAAKDRAAFSDFYRVAVDESLFDVKASPERKYWGFQIFIKALPRLPASEMPLVFTPNFMRVWINNLGGEERYLHKAALAIAQLVQTVTADNPTAGFTLLSQLLGKNGHRNFDRVTKTKTVSGIMASLSAEGVSDFVAYLQGLLNEAPAATSTEFDHKQVDARRTWIFDQLVSLIKNTTVPKTDTWVSAVLEFFVVHGLFVVKAANKKSSLTTLHTVPHPALSDAVHASSRTRLSTILGELSTESTLIKGPDGKQKRAVGCDSTGTLWTSRALAIVSQLDKDRKHVSPATEEDADVAAARQGAHAVLATLDKAPATKREAARGLQLLIQSVILQSYDDAEASLDVLEELESCATRMFAEKLKASKKQKAAAAEEVDDEEEDLAPIDILVDVLIGFLEKSSSQLRALASQVFGVLSGEATESTIDLLLAQLESRPVMTGDDDNEGEPIGSDEEMDDDEDDEDEDAESDDDEDSGLDEEDAEAEVDPELRKRIAEVLQVNGAAEGDADDDSESEEESLMGDDEMMAMDEKLVEIFRLRTEEKKGRKDAQREATHFKNRVLELVETFLKKQPTSPLVLRLVLPLLELVLHGSPTEAHLTSKVTGILQSRMFKAKEPLEIVDRAEAVEVLNALHTEARVASSAQTAKLCSQAILYVSRALLHDRLAASSSAGQDLSEPIVAAYTTSLDDFMTKKSTKVRASLFSDLATRFPVVAWSLRSALVQYAQSEGANSYRQTQAFNILNDLISQLPALSKAGLGAEIRELVPACRAAVYTILEAAGSGDVNAAKGLKADRLRDIVKFALKLARSSKAVLPEPADFTSAWAAESLPALVAGLKQSEKLKSSKGLLSSVDQLAQLVNAPPAGKAKGGKKGKKAAAADATSSAKPKAVAGGEGAAATDGLVPTKRKKAAAPAAEDGVKKAKKKSKKAE